MSKKRFDNTEFIFILKKGSINHDEKSKLFSIFEQKLDTNNMDKDAKKIYESIYIPIIENKTNKNYHSDFILYDYDSLFDLNQIDNHLEVDIGFKTDYEYTKKEKSIIMKDIFGKEIKEFCDQYGYEIVKSLYLDNFKTTELTEIEI